MYSRKKSRVRDERHCMFCNRNFPDAKFNNRAHLLPRSVGNSDLYSYFECDSCNNKFSLFETDLAAYLGIGRSIAGLSDAKKAADFPGIGVEARSIISMVGMFW